MMVGVGATKGLLLSALGQDLLDGLLLLQQKGADDALPDARGAGGAPVAPRHGPLALHGASPLGISQVLDPLERRLAVAALRTFGGLLYALRLEDSAGGADRPVAVLLRVVRMAGPRSVPTCVRHLLLPKFCNNKEVRKGVVRSRRFVPEACAPAVFRLSATPILTSS